MLKIGKNSEFDKFSWQRQKAIAQLFNGKTLKEVSQQVKVHLKPLQGFPFWYSLLTDETQRTPENMTLIDPSAAEVQKSIQK